MENGDFYLFETLKKDELINPGLLCVSECFFCAVLDK